MEGLCRLCADENKDSILNVIEDENSEICQQLRTVCQVDIRLNDSLPKLVCGECVWMMDTLFLFYTKVRKSQDTLKALLVVANTNRSFTPVMGDVEPAELHSDEDVNGLVQESLEYEDFEAIHEEDAVDDETITILQMKREKEFEKRLKMEIDIVAEHDYADLKQTEQKVFYLSTDSGAHEFFHESDDNTSLPPVSPLRSSSVQEASALLPSEDDNADEDMTNVVLDVGAEQSFVDVVEEEEGFLKIKSEKEENSDISDSDPEVNSPNPHLSDDSKSSQGQSVDDKFQGILSPNLKSYFNSSNNIDKRLYKCTICNCYFAYKRNLRVHMRRHNGDHPYQCAICNRFFAYQRTYRAHMRQHTGKRPHKCTVCESAFTRMEHLKNHMRRHTGERPYQCSVCLSAFTQRASLDTHMKRHTGDCPYKCTVCDSAFTQEGRLKTHMRQHTGERPFKCTICESAFTQQAHLKTHMRQHTGERPYKCTICDRAFAGQGSLKIHLRRHTGEHPYKCSICNSAFTEQGTLKIHMRLHTGDRPYKCSVCDAAFPRKDYLNNHMKHHSGERPYQCTVCDYTFAEQKSLKNHMSRHTNEHSYKCPICGCNFAMKGTLTKHLMRHNDGRKL